MTEKKRTLLGTAVLTFAIILIAFGIGRDEPATVLQKAIHICMECIGIG